MPKIIENLRERLLEEAKRQVLEQGYSAMTIRSVASACGVGVGTVYNYFASKDMLIASFMLEDWMECKKRIDKGCDENSTPESALRCIYDGLNDFVGKYEVLFRDENAGTSFAASSSKQRHILLRSQIAKPLVALCQKQEKADPVFLAEFVAEAMLTWSMSERSFEEISSVLLQLF